MRNLHRQPIELEPYTAAIAHHTLHATPNDRKPGLAQLIHRKNRVALPHTATMTPGGTLRFTMASSERYVWRDRDEIAQSLLEHQRFQIVPVPVVGMRQIPAVVISDLLARTQTKAPITGGDKLLEALLGSIGPGLAALPAAA